jgi:hypothetical protein
MNSRRISSLVALEGHSHTPPQEDVEKVASMCPRFVRETWSRAR